jgi:glycosyltransferase involved in cell wall biosynthesis
MPRVSVVMPAYNAVHFIGQAVASVFSQTFDDFELIVVNDGSNDDTLDILADYQDERLHVLHNDIRVGIATSLNRGIAVATGDYIARMDADDITLPTRFAQQVALLDAHPTIGFVATAHRNITHDGQLYPMPTMPDKTALSMHWTLLWTAGVAHDSVMLRRSLFGRNGIWYDPACEGAEDFDLWARLLHHVEPAFIAQPLLHVRVHPQSSSRTRLLMSRQAHERIMRRELTAFLGRHVSPEATTALAQLSLHPDKTTTYTVSTLQACTRLICDAYEQFRARYSLTAADEPDIHFRTQKLLGKVLRAMVAQRYYRAVVWHLATIPATVRYGQLRKLIKYHLRPASDW